MKKQLITNPKLSEASKIFTNSMKSHGGILGPSDVSNGLWDLLQQMTKFYGVERIDLSDSQYNKMFSKSGWIQFGIINNLSINALAFKQEGHQFVGINLGTLLFIRDTFMSLFSLKEFLPQIGDYNKESNTLEAFSQNFLARRSSGGYFQLIPNCEQRRNAADILTDLAINFVYHHEVAHLVFCHTDYFQSEFGSNELLEYPINEMTEHSYLDKKALELEADRAASEYSLQWLKLMDRSGFGKDLNPYNLFFIWIITIETVFKILDPMGTFRERQKETHPNNFIRILNIVLHSSQIAKDINLENDVKKSYDYLQASIELQHNIFNQIDFLPIGGTSKENRDLMQSYQQRADQIFESYLNNLCKKREVSIREEMERFA